MSKFPERLKQLRNEAGFSQQELASQLGCVSKSSINMYERGEREPSLETLESIADFFNVDMDFLHGKSDVKNKYSSLLAEIVKENESGRPAAIDELRRRFGTEHSTLSVYVCEDKKKLSVLYYHALERDAALAMKELIQDAEQLEPKQVEKIMYLVKAYLRAEQPIRDIVDTALRPYTEEEAAMYENALIG